jgi:hypothetical protein
MITSAPIDIQETDIQGALTEMRAIADSIGETACVFFDENGKACLVEFLKEAKELS